MTVLTAEMIAADEAKAAAQPASNSTPAKSAAASTKTADFATDPIDYTCGLRKQAGGMTSTRTKQDAAKEKLSTVEIPELKLPNEKAILQDLNPVMNENEGEVFAGFTKVNSDGVAAPTKSPEELKSEAEAQAAEEAKLAKERAMMEQCGDWDWSTGRGSAQWSSAFTKRVQ